MQTPPPTSPSPSHLPPGGPSPGPSTVEGLSLTRENLPGIAGRIKALHYWNDPKTRDVTVNLDGGRERRFKIERRDGRFSLGSVFSIRDHEELLLIGEIADHMNQTD